ncbi:hypothetical protein [Desulfofundulus thermobenzoicus]|nr:hypothetical protein [Desulfofundulus thermobenzoicus]
MLTWEEPNRRLSHRLPHSYHFRPGVGLDPAVFRRGLELFAAYLGE